MIQCWKCETGVIVAYNFDPSVESQIAKGLRMYTYADGYMCNYEKVCSTGC